MKNLRKSEYWAKKLLIRKTYAVETGINDDMKRTKGKHPAFPGKQMPKIIKLLTTTVIKFS